MLSADLSKYRSYTSILILIVFVLVSSAIYAPAFYRSFASDDYCTLDFLKENKSILKPGFFRPVGDLTLQWTLSIAGYKPFYFFVVNAVLHAANAWLLFLFCRKIQPSDEERLAFPFVASSMFLLYHSVGEVALWAIGRGISLAVTFTLLAMLLFVSEARRSVKVAGVSILYFIALCCYENVLLLPVVLLTGMYLKSFDSVRLPASSNTSLRSDKRDIGMWIAGFGLAVATNIILRVWCTGSMWASYSGKVFSKSIAEYAEAFIKMMWRIFVPAVDFPLIFAVIGMLALIAAASLVFAKHSRASDFYPLRIFAITGITAGAVMGMFYGASTRTSEGDRFLYFPAIFFAILLASFLVRITPAKLRIATIFLFGAMQIYFLNRTKNNWIEASRLSQQLISQVKATGMSPLFIINLPGEYRGAFQFRNCFKNALSYHGVDTAQVKVVNVLNHPESVTRQRSYVQQVTGDSWIIWPGTRIGLKGNSVKRINDEDVSDAELTLQQVAYWNGEKLIYLSR